MSKSSDDTESVLLGCMWLKMAYSHRYRHVCSLVTRGLWNQESALRSRKSRPLLLTAVAYWFNSVFGQIKGYCLLGDLSEAKPPFPVAAVYQTLWVALE